MTPERIEELTVAAETLYVYCDKEKGFFGGTFKDPETNRVYSKWNNYSGAKTELEKKLHRELSNAEITILALAVGYGPTPCLEKEMREIAMGDLWRRRQPDQRPGSYQSMRDVLTSFW